MLWCINFIPEASAFFLRGHESLQRSSIYHLIKFLSVTANWFSIASLTLTFFVTGRLKASWHSFFPIIVSKIEECECAENVSTLVLTTVWISPKDSLRIFGANFINVEIHFQYYLSQILLLKSFEEVKPFLKSYARPLFPFSVFGFISVSSYFIAMLFWTFILIVTSLISIFTLKPQWPLSPIWCSSNYSYAMLHFDSPTIPLSTYTIDPIVVSFVLWVTHSTDLSAKFRLSNFP